MKKLILLTIVLLNGTFLSAQTNIYKPKFAIVNFTPTIFLSANQQDTRTTLLFYPDYKVNGLQVISTHEPGTPYDYVFFIDKQGNTQYKTMNTTGFRNHAFNFQSQYDSFNPYGSQDFCEAVVTGFIYTLFREGTRKIGIR